MRQAFRFTDVVVKVCIIANPVAGRGRVQRLLPEIRTSFGDAGITDVILTTSEGDEDRLTRSCLQREATTIVAVGGDGTCTRIANAILSTGSACRLGVLPCGTGNDFAKTLGVSRHSAPMIAELCASGPTVRMDVGRADGHYFLNSCGFGFDASVLEASARVRFLKGDAVYIYSALAQLLAYTGTSVEADGARATDGDQMLMITVSNGRWLGGAFQIAPAASVLDGELDVAFFRDANVLRRVQLFAAALKGTHLTPPSVTSRKARRLSLRFPAPPAMEIDGELRHAEGRMVEIECVPKALSVVAAPNALI